MASRELLNKLQSAYRDVTAMYINEEQFQSVVSEVFDALTAAEEERDTLLEWVWLNHGHTGQYGDDGEMQCAQCEMEYGFFDWKRTPVSEIFEKIRAAKIAALHTTETEGSDETTS